MNKNIYYLFLILSFSFIKTVQITVKAYTNFHLNVYELINDRTARLVKTIAPNNTECVQLNTPKVLFESHETYDTMYFESAYLAVKPNTLYHVSNGKFGTLKICKEGIN